MNYLLYCGYEAHQATDILQKEEKDLLLPPGYLLIFLFGLDCLFVSLLVFNVKLFLIHVRKLAEVGGGTWNNFLNCPSSH